MIVFIVSVFIMSLGTLICINSVDKSYKVFMKEEGLTIVDMMNNKGYIYSDAFENRLESYGRDNNTKKNIKMLANLNNVLIIIIITSLIALLALIFVILCIWSLRNI